MKKTTDSEIRSLLEEMRSQLASLSQRVALLEGASANKANRVAKAPDVAAPPTPKPVSAPAPQAISEEEILAISAALAAFLGVRVRIRQMRLISSAAWAQQGRVSIQASHQLHG
jgi:methylmalonyl-CoA carboxyltransferase large subunit